MSFRELTMIDVKEVLRRWQAGQSARQMARERVVGRRTAARYVDAAKELGVALDAERTDDLVGAVAGRVQERPVPKPSVMRQALDQHRAQIEDWLKDDAPLTLVRVQELLGRNGGLHPVHHAAPLLARRARLERAWTNGAHRRSSAR